MRALTAQNAQVPGGVAVAVQARHSSTGVSSSGTSKAQAWALQGVEAGVQAGSGQRHGEHGQRNEAGRWCLHPCLCTGQARCCVILRSLHGDRIGSGGGVAGRARVSGVRM